MYPYIRPVIRAKGRVLEVERTLGGFNPKGYEETEELQEWIDSARERAARSYIWERCSQKRFLECSELERITGWNNRKVRRFICIMQDAWRDNQGIRPRGRPRKNRSLW